MPPRDMMRTHHMHGEYILAADAGYSCQAHPALAGNRGGGMHDSEPTGCGRKREAHSWEWRDVGQASLGASRVRGEIPRSWGQPR
jgi:hypothetical protein